jgi:hypothetical protein
MVVVFAATALENVLELPADTNELVVMPSEDDVVGDLGGMISPRPAFVVVVVAELELPDTIPIPTSTMLMIPVGLLSAMAVVSTEVASAPLKGLDIDVGVLELKSSLEIIELFDMEAGRVSEVVEVWNPVVGSETENTEVVGVEAASNDVGEDEGVL